MNGGEYGARKGYRKKGQSLVRVAYLGDHFTMNELTNGNYDRSGEAVPMVNDIFLRRCQLGP